MGRPRTGTNSMNHPPETFRSGRPNEHSTCELSGPGIAALALLLALSGCTLDFGSFETGGNDVSSDTAVEDSTPPENDAADTTVDAPHDSGADGGDGGGGIGSDCEDDQDCAAGTCVRSYCTKDCSSDPDCPNGTECGRLFGSERCVVPCPEYDECSIPDRSNVTCAPSDVERRVGARAELSLACLPDGDDDRVSDSVDNCRGKANAAQRDRDDDGSGDACDPEPRCHDSASMGVLELGNIEYPAEDPVVPPIVGGTWLPVFGGQENGSPSAARARIDLEAGEWTSASELPYAARNQLATPLVGSEAYATTPGETSANGTASGRFLVLREDGSVQFDGGFDLSAEKMVIATTGSGALVALGYQQNSAGNPALRIWRYRPDDGRFTQFFDEETSGRREWRVVADARGSVFFYTAPDPTTTPPQQGRILEVDPVGETAQNHTIEYPTLSNPSGSRPVEPLLVPGPGNRHLYAFDRQTGRAVIVDLVDDAAARAPKLDLTLPFELRAASVQPSAPALVLVGRDSEDDSKLRARALYLGCHPGLSDSESDADSHPDLSDNCPTVPNEKQRDADRDGIGDACDNDADNDAVDNVDDTKGNQQLSRDTDDDGTVNVEDDDIDGDGIVNSRDRYPFDTDNDGLPNHLDEDDDDDGYDDDFERQSDRNTTDPLSFPEAGTVAFVERNASGDRTVKVGGLEDLEEAKEVVGASERPHRPRLFDGGDGVVALGGSPGSTSAVVSWSEATAGTTNRDLDRSLRGVQPVDVDQSGRLQSVDIIRQTPNNGDQWQIGTYTFGSQSFSAGPPPFESITSFDRYDDRTAFLAGARNCSGCISLYAYDASDDAPTLVAAPPGRLRGIQYEPVRYTVTSTIESGNSTRKRAFELFGRRGFRRDEIEGPEFSAIDSVVPLDLGGHLLVSAERGSGTFDIWFFNDRTNRWDRALSSSNDLIEIDWIR